MYCSIVYDLPCLVCCRYAALCTPASVDTGLAVALGWLEPLRDVLRLREVFGRGTPKEQASGDSPDRERNPQLGGHAEEAVFHVVWLAPSGRVMRVAVSFKD